MDDKLIRLARKVKTLEDELNRISKIKDLDGLLLANSDMSSRYKKSIAETVGMYKDYISNTKKELTDSFEKIKEEHNQNKAINKKNINDLENKITQIKDDIQKVCTSIDKSIEDIQKDILKDIKDKNNQILLNLDKKDKELKEVKKENTSLNKDLKALKDLVGKLELQKGDDGKSAYDIACELGFKGTKEEWIKSLHGKDGQDIELRGLRAFSDVKNDNKMYARKNKKWVEVENYDDTEIREDIEELQEENETQTEQIEALQTENTRLKATLPTTTGSGENVTLQNTAELEFIQPPLPRGNSEQDTRQGYNLLNPTLETKTTNGVTCTNNGDGTYTLNGTATASTNFQLFTTSPTISSGTYKLVGCKNGSYSTYSLRAYNSATSTLKVDIGSGVTFTTNENLAFQFFIDIANGTTFNNVIFKPMLTTNTSLTYDDYEQYGAMPSPDYPSAISNVTGDVEVKIQNKNLFDTENATIRNNAYINYNTGAIAGSSTTNYATENYIEIEASTIYTLANATSGMRLAFYDENQTYISGKNSSFIGFTTPSNAKYIRFSDTDLSTVMLIKGNNTATTYTPHKEQTFTFPLGTQRMYLGDYLADDGIHHVRGQITFDGSDDERIEKMFGNIYNGKCLYLLYQVHKQQAGAGLSNAFKETLGMTEFYPEGINFSYSNNAFGLIILSERINNNYTVPELKTWLSTHNVTVEYELATEEIIPYTTEQQAAYDEIKQVISYEEQTNISGSSDESNPIFSVEAYQSIKLILAS